MCEYFTKINIGKAEEALRLLDSHGSKIAIAESCTGGVLSGMITEISGASKVFDRGFVTYSNSAKTEMLGVSSKTIKEFGAVSSEVAKEMVLGAVSKSKANVAISITGIAGPDSDNSQKPVGLVYFGLAVDDLLITKKENFTGSRSEIRSKSIEHALDFLLNHLKG